MFHSQGAGSVQTHQPVRLGTGNRSLIQCLIISCVPQAGKSLANRLICNRRNPQPFHGFFDPGFLDDPPRHQFPFPSCICSYDNLPDILSKHLGFYRLVLLSRLLDDLDFQALWQHGKGFHLPRFPLVAIAFWICQFHKMAKSPSDHIIVSFQISIASLFASQDSRNISAHAGLFCNY